MGKRDKEDDFLADYKEWIQHLHNPYRWLGTISNFGLRAYRKEKRYRRREGIIPTIVALTVLGFVIAIAWKVYYSGGVLSALPFLIFFIILAGLVLVRGIKILLGYDPDRNDGEQD